VGLDGARQHLDVAVGIDRDDPRYSRVGVIIADDDVVPANDVAL
jgi:hypothetical protein